MGLTVSAIQMAMVDDVDANVATAERLVRKAAAEGAQLVLIPELFEGPYFCKDMLPEHFDRARPVDGHPTVEHFRTVAAELGVVLPLSIYERANHATFNSVVVVDADGARPRHLSQEPHPRRPGLHREVLLQPRRHRVPRVAHPTRRRRGGHLLGSVVPGVGALHGPARRRRALLSDGDRLGAARPAVGFQRPLAARDARSRRRQPHAAHRRQPHRPRARERRRRSRSTGRRSSPTPPATRSPKPAATARPYSPPRSSSTRRSDLRHSWGLFRDRRPDLYGPLLTLDGTTSET